MIEAFWAIGACLEVFIAFLVMDAFGWRILLALSSVPCALFCAACVVRFWFRWFIDLVQIVQPFETFEPSGSYGTDGSDFGHLVHMVHFQWLPESARFHMACGQPDLAKQTLERIAHENGVPMLTGTLVEPKVSEGSNFEIWTVDGSFKPSEPQFQRNQEGVWRTSLANTKLPLYYYGSFGQRTHSVIMALYCSQRNCMRMAGIAMVRTIWTVWTILTILTM